MPNRTRDPRTKEEFLDRMLSFDFDGDIRHLGVNDARIERVGPNRCRLSFPASGRTYELSVHLPREEQPDPKPKAASATPDREPEGRSFETGAEASPSEEGQPTPRRGRRRTVADQWTVGPTK